MYREDIPENIYQPGRLDEEFIRLMAEIEKHYTTYNKHERIRIEQWCRKLCQVSVNKIWKQNRNLYAFLLLSSILEGTLVEPFNKIPPESYLPALNKHAVKGKIEAVQHRLTEKLFIQDNYQSPPKKSKHRRVASMGGQISPLKVDTKMASNFPFPNLDTNQQARNTSLGFTPNQYQQHQPQINAHEKNGRVENKNSSRENKPRPLSPKSKYLMEVQISQREQEEVRDVRILQGQLDLARSTIETLKDELSTRFMAISQLNKQLEAMSFELHQFDKDRSLWEKFMANLSNSIKERAIVFKDTRTFDNFAVQINELCEVLSLPQLKLETSSFGELDQPKQKSARAKYNSPALKNDSRSAGVIVKEAVEEVYNKQGGSKIRVNDFFENYKKPLYQDNKKPPKKNGPNVNNNSDYINVFNTENDKLKQELSEVGTLSSKYNFLDLK